VHVSSSRRVSESSTATDGGSYLVKSAIDAMKAS